MVKALREFASSISHENRYPGSAEFSQHMMAYINALGMSHKDGRLWDENGSLVNCPNERAFFKAIYHPWLEPAERENGCFQLVIATHRFEAQKTMIQRTKALS